MAIELLAILARANLALTGALVFAMMLRAPLQRWFGPQRSYALWLVAPLALLGAFMPAPRGSGPQRLLERAESEVQTMFSAEPWAYAVLFTLWIAGVCVSMILVARRHQRFVDESRAGRAGPAVVGVIGPRLITPSDFKATFSAREQLLIRAHERAHMDRFDGRWNALAALVQSLFWFNPIVHIAVRAMKLHQELACDAVVIDRFPQDRRVYARALLSAQTSSASSPWVCPWTSGRLHPLVERLRAIADRPPPAGRDGLWIAVCLSIWAVAVIAPWAAEPPNRTLDRHAVQYVHFSGRHLGPSNAVWKIAINPD